MLGRKVLQYFIEILYRPHVSNWNTIQADPSGSRRDPHDPSGYFEDLWLSMKISENFQRSKNSVKMQIKTRSNQIEADFLGSIRDVDPRNSKKISTQNWKIKFFKKHIKHPPHTTRTHHTHTTYTQTRSHAILREIFEDLHKCFCKSEWITKIFWLKKFFLSRIRNSFLTRVIVSVCMWCVCGVCAWCVGGVWCAF